MDSRSQRLSTRLNQLWDRGLLPRPDFGQLQADADRLADETAAGVAYDWRGPFEDLLASLTEEARLNAVGLTFSYVQIGGLLRQRRAAWALWRKHPGILDMPVTAPVIILGQMRSGTTRLQRLLGCDTRFNHSRFFEVMEPLPPRPDLRVVKSWAQLKMLDYLNPELRRIHPTAATAVEEVFGLHSFSFYGAQIEAQWHVPAFVRRWQAADRGPVYAEFRQLLQTIAWQRGDATRPWVLKAPQFMEDLDELLRVFPDARLICLHRDARDITASTASLVWNQRRVQSDEADRREIGREWLMKTERRQRVCATVRKSRPDIQQIDLSFAAMNDDWRAEMERLYDFLGMSIDDKVIGRMARYLHVSEKSGFRSHRYRLEDFGVSADDVRKSFEPV